MPDVFDMCGAGWKSLQVVLWRMRLPESLLGREGKGLLSGLTWEPVEQVTVKLRGLRGSSAKGCQILNHIQNVV